MAVLSCMRCVSLARSKLTEKLIIRMESRRLRKYVFICGLTFLAILVMCLGTMLS